MPVFSNIGETTAPTSLLGRAPVSVIFGAAISRRRVYEKYRDRASPLNDLVELLGIERFLDIGPETIIPSSFLGRELDALGALDAADVSAHFAQARLGIVDYPRHVLTKSGIIAAYLAHGNLVANCSTDGTPTPDIRAGIHYVDLRRLPQSFGDAEAIAEQGHKWYRGHDRGETAKLLHQLLT
jgi:hypothetical protein